MLLVPERAKVLGLERLLSRLQLPADAVVADVGAGPGFLTLPLARAVQKGHVIATDVRPDYLAVLEARAAEAHLTNIKTQLVAPDRPGLADRSVDVAILCQVDQYLPARTRYFKRLAASLRKGGRMVVENFERHRAADLAAAQAASLRVLEQWKPSEPFFVLILGKQ
jgi:ubiquinone/menaquinone biosynthesis C-methylase UbiE